MDMFSKPRAPSPPRGGDYFYPLPGPYRSVTTKAATITPTPTPDANNVKGPRAAMIARACGVACVVAVLLMESYLFTMTSWVSVSPAPALAPALAQESVVTVTTRHVTLHVTPAFMLLGAVAAAVVLRYAEVACCVLTCVLAVRVLVTFIVPYLVSHPRLWACNCGP